MNDYAVFDGRTATLAAGDTSVDVVGVPPDKTLRATRLNIANHSGALARVRLWDAFTDSEGNVHDAETNPILLADHALNIDESLESVSEAGLFKAIGTVIAQSTSAGAAPDDVSVGVWGWFE
jgi:hypothetical protein